MAGVKSIAQLKGIYANAHSMDNKEEELEGIVQQGSYDIVAITHPSTKKAERRTQRTPGLSA